MREDKTESAYWGTRRQQPKVLRRTLGTNESNNYPKCPSHAGLLLGKHDMFQMTLDITANYPLDLLRRLLANNRLYRTHWVPLAIRLSVLQILHTT